MSVCGQIGKNVTLSFVTVRVESLHTSTVLFSTTKCCGRDKENMSLQSCIERTADNCTAPCVLEYRAEDVNPTCVPPASSLLNLELSDDDVSIIKTILERLLPDVSSTRFTAIINNVHDDLGEFVKRKIIQAVNTPRYNSWRRASERIAAELINEIEALEHQHDNNPQHNNMNNPEDDPQRLGHREAEAVFIIVYIVFVYFLFRHFGMPNSTFFTLLVAGQVHNRFSDVRVLVDVAGQLLPNAIQVLRNARRNRQLYLNGRGNRQLYLNGRGVPP